MSRHAFPPLYGDRCNWGLIRADSLAFLQLLPDRSVEAVLCDPPYGIGFAGKEWDGGLLNDPEGFQAFTTAWAGEVRRVLRPGGYLAAFGAPRTFHRLVAGVEDAGLEVRDSLLWLYGSGAPKSRRLEFGLGTALKPAYEPILLARAPLEQGRSTISNLEVHGTGGLDITTTAPPRPPAERKSISQPDFWPPNVLLSHQPECDEHRGCLPECVVPLIDRHADASRRRSSTRLSRLFYAAKASPAEREAGCEHLEQQVSEIFSSRGRARPRANIHSTVKPITLMRWLTRLIVPPGGVVLDPFAGSGSTGIAAVLEGRQFLGIEREFDYVDIARARLTHWTSEAS